MQGEIKTFRIYSNGTFEAYTDFQIKFFCQFYEKRSFPQKKITPFFVPIDFRNFARACENDGSESYDQPNPFQQSEFQLYRVLERE